MSGPQDVFTAPEGQGVAVIASGGKVKLVSETVLLSSAYALGWRDGLVELEARVKAHGPLPEQSVAEVLALIQEVLTQ